MDYSSTAWERAMRMQDVILRAISGEISWVELPVRFLGSQALDGLNIEARPVVGSNRLLRVLETAPA